MEEVFQLLNETNSSLPLVKSIALPTFNTNVLIQVIVYSVLLVIASAGNLTVLISLLRGRHRKSRISLMILHLTIADLIVTLIMIPLEIGWRITVQWTAGNLACKVFTVLRAFGLYLSSNVLVCVSMDRYFAILHPLRSSDAQRRGKFMLAIAWLFSSICAFPQSLVFHVSQHPADPTFLQCVTFGSFASEFQEKAYNVFCISVMYFVPLVVIVFAYSCILYEISSKSRETRVTYSDAREVEAKLADGISTDSETQDNTRCARRMWRPPKRSLFESDSNDESSQEDNKNLQNRDQGQQNGAQRGRMQLRRSDMSNIARARSRTLRMTITIVAAFVWCWTPYVVITMWYIIDRNSASKVDSHVQNILFIMAVSNSCMNPIVYGSFSMNLHKDCCCFSKKYASTNNLVRRSTMKSTTTKTTMFNGCRRRRFTFTVNPPHPVGRPGVQSECLPCDDDRDSGVSISYRGRPYHSEPAHPAIMSETAFYHEFEGELNPLKGTTDCNATSRESMRNSSNSKLHSSNYN